MLARLAGSIVATSFVTGAALAAANLDGAPPSFGYRNQVVVPVDIESVHVEYVFDVAASRTRARATVDFVTGPAGLPMLDLVPNPTAVTFDGESLALSEFAVVDDPSRVTRLRVVNRAVEADSLHRLEVEYALSASDVTFTSGRARAGFFMSDLAGSGRSFMEKYAPANFEFDHIAYTIDVRVENTTIEHEVFTNGAVTSLGANHWRVAFPSYFTASSPYFHLSEKGRFQVERFDYQGIAATIPVTVYADSASLVRSAVTNVQSVMAELERDYGPYTHDQLLLYVTSGGGGMEYGGATMTSLWALEHEVTHFWFARGVMPQDGNAGWIDEAVASWRDDGYPRARSAPNRSPVNLGGFSSYKRDTSYDSYSLGARLISELDFLFAAQGGMKPILRDLYAEHKRTTISSTFFQSFLEAATGTNLASIFSRYVYGRASAEAPAPARAAERAAPPLGRHPRPYTPEELSLYR